MAMLFWLIIFSVSAYRRSHRRRRGRLSAARTWQRSASFSRAIAASALAAAGLTVLLIGGGTFFAVRNRHKVSHTGIDLVEACP